MIGGRRIKRSRRTRRYKTRSRSRSQNRSRSRSQNRSRSRSRRRRRTRKRGGDDSIHVTYDLNDSVTLHNKILNDYSIITQENIDKLQLPVDNENNILDLSGDHSQFKVEEMENKNYSVTIVGDANPDPDLHLPMSIRITNFSNDQLTLLLENTLLNLFNFLDREVKSIEDVKNIFIDNKKEIFEKLKIFLNKFTKECSSSKDADIIMAFKKMSEPESEKEIIERIEDQVKVEEIKDNVNNDQDTMTQVKEKFLNNMKMLLCLQGETVLEARGGRDLNNVQRFWNGIINVVIFILGDVLATVSKGLHLSPLATGFTKLKKAFRLIRFTGH